MDFYLMQYMRVRKLSTVSLALAALFTFCGTLKAQSVESALDQSYHAMYNLQFNDALRTLEQAKTLDKDDPLPWMAQSCALLFREFDRLNILTSEMFTSDDKFNSRTAHSWEAEARRQFDDALNSTEKLAQQRLARDKNDTRALFALTISNGLRADDAALIAKKNLSALSYTKTAEGYAERLLAVSPGYYDAYVATGMGKYIIGGKAAPVRWVLRLGGLKGDQAEGVKELNLVAEHGRYLAPFAEILLTFDDLRHKNIAQARKKLAWLREQFPNNSHFLEELAKLDGTAPPPGE
jgi:hypothetical protein